MNRIETKPSSSRFIRLLFYVIGLLFGVVMLLTEITALEPPMITSWSADVSVEIGEQVYLTCTAEPSPVVDVEIGDEDPNEDPAGDSPSVRILYSWYRCEDPTGSDIGTELNAPAEENSFISVDTTIPGMFYYYCTVYATDGAETEMNRTPVITVTVNGEITVREPQIITPLRESYEVPKGAELLLTLHCEDQAPGVTTVWEWYRKDESDGNRYERIATGTNGLFYVPTDTIGTFTYFCRITASAGTTTKTTQSSFATIRVTGHDHEFGEWFTTSFPTCLVEGSRERSCSCGYIETEIIPKLDHQFGDWTITREGVGDHPAQEGRTCSMCGMMETRDYIPPQTEPPVTEPIDTTEPPVTDSHQTEPPVTNPPDTTAPSWNTIAPTTTGPKKNDPQKQTNTPFPAYWLVIAFGLLCTILGTWGAIHFLFKSMRQRSEEKRLAKAAAIHRQQAQQGYHPAPGGYPPQYPGRPNSPNHR